MSKFTKNEIEGQSQVINITLGYFDSLNVYGKHQQRYLDYVSEKLKEL